MGPIGTDGSCTPTGHTRTIRARRRATGLTQEALAERAGLSQKHVARMERAERVPTVHAVLLVARALGVSASDLVREVEEATAAEGP